MPTMDHEFADVVAADPVMSKILEAARNGTLSPAEEIQFIFARGAELSKELEAENGTG